MVSFIKTRFRKIRKKIIRLWRLNALIQPLVRYNKFTGYWGRRLFEHIPFLLPHDKSYYGFAHLVKPGDGLFVDVGANDGISAIGFKHIHSDYRVLSIEPNRCHEPSLRRLTRKLKNFEYRIAAAGVAKDKLVLHVPLFKGVPIYTAASLSKTFSDQSMRHQFGAGHQAQIQYVEQIVEIVKLDEWQLKPDIIKIDTEGHEYEVLLGLQETIDKHQPFILIEYNPALINIEQEFFKQRQYLLFHYNFKRDVFNPFVLDNKQQPIYAGENLFCIPQGKLNVLPLKK